jgi:superfamily II DNA/RNA helicase
MPTTPSRDELAERYLDQLRYDLYPVQEEALLAWFSAEQGVLVCAPTGMGKTLIAEAALFEALHTGKRAYYTTPLIALTEQKFREMQELAVRWGFAAADVGLVTGNRRENPDARVLVVVAEILFNRLLHPEAFDFGDVGAVVMDEFHSFNDRERGIVWEFSLALLPEHVRTLLLSATVGNSLEFVGWLKKNVRRRLELVQGDQRKVPLTFQWVPDRLLSEQLEEMAQGDEDARTTPALVFCFNRDQCWTVAEQIKGKRVLGSGQQARLVERLKQHDWSQGAGPALRQLLMRGVGVHHAGVLPKYRRIVEELFQQKLLSVVICTETLSAGINLPARSVVLPNILKGPPGEKKVMEPSSAQQIFGRAGRPQFDSQGYVFVLAHEDDVKIARWREQYDRIPEGTKDPGLLRAKRQLKKKMPKRRTTEQYWTEAQFDKLRAAPPGKLRSTGPLPWRLLAYMLEASPDVELVRTLVGKRLMDSKRLQRGQEALDAMLITLWRAGYVTLDPEPPRSDSPQVPGAATTSGGAPCGGVPAAEKPEPKKSKTQLLLEEALSAAAGHPSSGSAAPPAKAADAPPRYQAKFAYPTPTLHQLVMLRGVNPLYGVFLVNQLGIANRQERVQAMESVLELPRSVGHYVRVPDQDELPPGPLATTRLNEQLLRLGLVTSDQLVAPPKTEEYGRRRIFDEERPWVLTLAEKLRLQFDYDFPGVHDVRTQPVWAAGEVLEFGGNFNKYVTGKHLQKQEGVIFRHLLRLILLAGELAQLCPPDTTEEEWRGDLQDVAQRLTAGCREVDPSSTDKALEQGQAAADEIDL